MLIKALCDYADKIEEEPDSTKIPDGWSEQKVSFRILLTPDGEVADIIDLRVDKNNILKNGKVKVSYEPVNMILPERTQKTCINSNIIEHRPLYIFGLNFDKEKLTTDDKGKATKSHDAFVKCNLEFFDGLDSEICQAYRNFIHKWIPEKEIENPHLLSIGKLYKSSYFCFGLNGHPEITLEKDEQFIKKYSEYIENKSSNKTDTDCAICGILGEKLPISRIHDKIKFPGGNSVGCVLVGMNETAFESYGKKQSYNSNISEVAMKKYTSALNKLLTDKKHFTRIDDMIIVYFAMKSNDSPECQIMSMFFGDVTEQTDDNLNKIFSDTAGGMVANLSSVGADSNVTFYIAGMTSNSSRICQKFVYRDKFGKLMENLIQHQEDLCINPEKKRQVYFSSIAKQLLSPKSSKDKIPPPLMSGIILAAFNGTNYPSELLSNVVRRVKIDSDTEKNYFVKLNDIRAGIIKACINRKLRLSGQKEEITMSLNKENHDPAYLSGRLFAVLEKIQQDASGGNLNKTIKDSYFSSACSRPSSIFPKLIQLSQYHIKKLSDGNIVFYQKLIGEIMDGMIDKFPHILDLDSQGKFIIGYYQQNKALYTKNND